MVTSKAVIHIESQATPPIIPVVQGDTGRSILFTLADFTIPTGATATYYIQKPSGNAVYNNAVIEGNTITANLTAQSIAEIGDNYGQVRIAKDGEVVTSFDFILLVKEFRGIDATESITEMNIFDKAVQQAETEITTAKDSAIEEITTAKGSAIEEIAASAENIAEEFSTANSYLAGEFVLYDGKLYKFTADHSGAWTGTDAEQLTVGDALSDAGEQIETNTADINQLKEDILDITKMGLSVIEQTVSQDIISHRTGRVWERKVWKYSVNQTADCPALDDYNDGVAVPFTDTAVGSDPYMDTYRVFRWMHCNYYREADGTARLITIEGYSDYAETGSVDVGTLLPTFWWAWNEYDDYWVLKFSDSPGEGLTPWKDAVRADGTVLPYFIVSAYPSVIASDGKLRSQKGKPANNQSYNNIITNYQKKGEGYWGAGSSINTLAYIYLIVKYQTKLEQNKFATNCGFSINAPVAKAESEVKRVLVASTETRFAKGDGVTVGTANNAYWLNGSLVPWAEVTSVEDVTVDGTAYKAIYLDVDSAFSTTTEMYVVGSTCPSGQTDGVIGHYDGSIVSNTDSKHSIRIEGIELMNGLWFVLSDTVISFLNNYWQIYVAQKGAPHTANAHTGYKLIGESDAFTSDSYVGNVSFDVETGAMYHAEKGNSNANGNGAYHWNGGTEVADGTLREWRGWGSLGYGRTDCGLVACYGWYALSDASAYTGSRD